MHLLRESRKIQLVCEEIRPLDTRAKIRMFSDKIDQGKEDLIVWERQKDL